MSCIHDFCSKYYIHIVFATKVIFNQIADDLDTVTQHSRMMLGLLHLLDCKICKNVPTNAVLVLCCNQVLGCHDCFNQSVQNNNPCPLCRATSPQCVRIKGYDALFEFLRGVHQ